MMNIRLKTFLALFVNQGAFRFGFWRATLDLLLVKIDGRTRNGHL